MKLVIMVLITQIGETHLKIRIMENLELYLKLQLLMSSVIVFILWNTVLINLSKEYKKTDTFCITKILVYTHLTLCLLTLFL